jgi:hypothetical protein
MTRGYSPTWRSRRTPAQGRRYPITESGAKTQWKGDRRHAGISDSRIGRSPPPRVSEMQGKSPQRRAYRGSETLYRAQIFGWLAGGGADGNEIALRRRETRPFDGDFKGSLVAPGSGVHHNAVFGERLREIITQCAASWDTSGVGPRPTTSSMPSVILVS